MIGFPNLITNINSHCTRLPYKRKPKFILSATKFSYIYATFYAFVHLPYSTKLWR